MMKFILSSMFAWTLAVAPAAAQTPTPAKPTTQKPAPTKPAAPTTKPAPATKPPATTTKPAAPATTTAKPATTTPVTSAVKYGPGVYAHIATNHGTMVARLFDKEAPKTVENFV